jgi:hypothetical protein
VKGPAGRSSTALRPHPRSPLRSIDCVAQGETSFGIDAGLGSVAVSARLSIRNGIGVSPSAKMRGIVHTTISRDFCLISF